MDRLGCHLNAFTDKEFTCYYLKMLKEHLHGALAIVADMLRNSVFDQVEIDRERNVILEEISHSEDSPEEKVHELLAEIMWPAHPLGKPILGKAESISGITRESLVGYADIHYKPNTTVISAAGNVSHRELVDTVRELFDGFEGTGKKRSAEQLLFNRTDSRLSKDTQQVHFCLGSPAFAQGNEAKYAMAATDAVVGAGMSSRLFQEIRESRGLAYSIGSYASSYADGGAFVIYGGTTLDKLDQVLELAKAECADIAKNSVTDDELERAHNQIRAALVISQEGMSNRMTRLAKNEFYFGKLLRLQETIDRMAKVDRNEVARVAEQLFDGQGFALAAIGPFSGS